MSRGYRSLIADRRGICQDDLSQESYRKCFDMLGIEGMTSELDLLCLSAPHSVYCKQKTVAQLYIVIANSLAVLHLRPKLTEYPIARSPMLPYPRRNKALIARQRLSI